MSEKTRDMPQLADLAHSHTLHEYYQLPEYEHRLGRRVRAPLWFSQTLPLKVCIF